MATEIKVILAQNTGLKGKSFESKILHLGLDNQTKRVNDRFSLIIGTVSLERPKLLIHLCIYEGGSISLSSPDYGF